MGGVSFEDECEFPTSLSNENQARTVVLLGKTGNGQSSTGNSIIGKKVFKSKFSFAGVTTTCEIQTTTVANTNRVINVIDTPGLFDYSGDVDYIGKEIVKCIDMGKDGIHAVLVVLSLRTRFTREEQGVIESLRKFFGNNISNYMIVVFTSADALEDETLDDYLLGSPDLLKETLKMCGNRCLLFDNKTEDAAKKSEQLQKLLALVDDVVNYNETKYLTRDGELDNLVGSSKKDDSEFKEHFNKISEMVESKLRATTRWLEEQLAKEHAARLKAEADAKDVQKKSEEEMRVLRGEMERARQKAKKDAQKKTEEEIRNLRGELERARMKAEAESKDAQHKADEELRILRDKLERAVEQKKEHMMKEELEKARKETEQLKKEKELRDRLEKAKEEAEKARAEKEAEELKKKKEYCAIM